MVVPDAIRQVSRLLDDCASQFRKISDWSKGSLQPWEIPSIEQKLADLTIAVRSIHNISSASVNSLPPEILAEIFRLVARSESAYGEDVGVLRVSHTCRRWHTIALGCPSVWSNIAITPGSGPRHLVSLFLSRSGDSPLSVDIHNFDGFDEDSVEDWYTFSSSLELVAAQSSRVREIVLHSSESKVRQFTVARLTFPVPNLEILKVEKQVYGRITGMPSLFQENLPSLHTLDLEGIAVRSPTFVNSLTRLTLRRGGVRLLLSDLLNVLENNPRLADVHLDSYNAHTVDVTSDRLVSLNFLTTLWLENCLTEVILPHLVLPAIVRVKTASRDIRGHDHGIFAQFPPHEYWPRFSNLFRDVERLAFASTQEAIWVECISNRGSSFHASADAKYHGNDSSTVTRSLAYLPSLSFRDVKYLFVRTRTFTCTSMDEFPIALWRGVLESMPRLEALDLGNSLGENVFKALTRDRTEDDVLCPRLSLMKMHICKSYVHFEPRLVDTLAALLGLLQSRAIRGVELKVWAGALSLCEPVIKSLHGMLGDWNLEVEADNSQ